MARWQVIRRLGEGGVGTVSLAVAPDGERVAVKILTDSARASLLEHEAKLLAKLHHPAIAALRGYVKDSSDIFGTDQGPSFWMEYVEGEDFLTAAEQAGRDPRKIAAWLVQALEALNFLHAQGVLHGDLAPGNVRIASSSSLKLIDFGMANLAGQAGAFNAATLLYLAPERVGGKNTPATDLFSLGTLFYEALAGVHPRAGCSSLRDMIRRPATPLLEARPDLKTDHALLARVVDRMILADPGARFAEASEVLAALRGGVPKASEAPEAFYPVSLVGEAGRWAASVEEAVGQLGKKSKFFALHGVTGTGKKRLLKEAAFHAALSGLPVREWGASQFREGMEALAASSGLVVFRSLEGVAPAELARVLHLRRRQLPAAGLLVLWEWNEDRAGDDSRRVLEGLSAHPDVEDIALKNLDENGAKELVRAALGDEAAVASGGDLHRLTAGNPLALLEVLSEVRRSDDVAQAIRGLKGADDILKQRIADLPADERLLLELLAVGHWSADLDDLFRAHGGESEVLFPALDRLAAKGLVGLESDTGRYRCAAEGLEATVLKSLPERDEIERHRSWWAVLSAARAESPQKLHHALALRDLEYVGRVAPEVIETLRAARHFGEALRLSGAALDALKDSGDPVVRSRLLRIQGNLLNETGRYREALAVADEVFKLAASDEPMPVKTVKHWLVTGLIHQNLGDRAEAEKRFERLLAEARRFGADVPAFYALRALSLLGIEALRGGDLPAARARFEEGLASPEAKGWRRAEILRNLAVVDHREGDAAASFRRLEDARELYRAEDNAEGEYACRLEQGNLSLDAGDFAVAESAYAGAETIARERDDDLLFASLWNNRGVMERKRGNLAASLERLQDALALFRPLGNAADLAECLKQNAITDAEVGRFEAAYSKIAEIRRLATRFPGADEKAKEAESVLLFLRDGNGAGTGIDGQRLKDLYARLPKALQVSFEERFDYKTSLPARRP